MRLFHLEDLIQVMLTPSHFGLKAGKFPDAIDQAIPGGSFPMCMTLILDFAQLGVRVLVVCNAHLVEPVDVATFDLNPFARPNEVLRLDALVSEELVT